MAEEKKMGLAWYFSIWSDNRHEFGQPARLGTSFQRKRSYMPDVVFMARGIAQAKEFIARLNRERVPNRPREEMAAQAFLAGYLDEAEKH